MRASCRCGTAAERVSALAAPLRRKGFWLMVAPALGALFMPKCPLCVLAWLSLLGVILTSARGLAVLLGFGAALACVFAIAGARKRSKERGASGLSLSRAAG